MKCLIYIFAMLFILSCKSYEHENELPKKYLYFPFKHVEEINDEDNILLRYELKETKLSSTERDTLVQILRESHRDFLITIDGQVLISQATLINLDALSSIDDELNRRIKNK